MGETTSYRLIRVIVVQETEVDLSGVLKNGLSFEINLDYMVFPFISGTYKTWWEKLAYLLLSYFSNYGNPVKFIKLLKCWLKKINVEINISYYRIPLIPRNNTPFIKTFISYVENNPQNFYNFIFGNESYLQFGEWRSPTDVYPTSLLWWRNRHYKDLEDMWERRDKFRGLLGAKLTNKVEYMLCNKDEIFPTFPDNVKVFYNV